MVENKADLSKTPYEFKDITKWVEEKQQNYIDVAKLQALGYKVNAVLTARGYGKTYNSKLFAYQEFMEKDKVSVWLRNRVKDIESEAKRFLSKDCDPEMRKNCKFIGNADNGTLWLCARKNGKWIPFMWFLAMATAEDSKGSRTLVDYVFMDEINVGLRDIQANYMDLFKWFMGSITDPRSKVQKPLQFFIFLNNKTLNHPLLMSLGITTANQPFQDLIDKNGNKMWCFFFEMWSEEEREAEDKERANDTNYQLAKLIGSADSIYYNDSEEDDPNFVYSYVEEEDYNPTLKSPFFSGVTAFYYKGQYIFVYNILKKNPLQTEFHVTTSNSLQTYARKYEWKEYKLEDMLPKDPQDNKPMFYNVKEDKESGWRMPTQVRDTLREYLFKNLISFENLYDRATFLEMLK